MAACRGGGPGVWASSAAPIIRSMLLLLSPAKSLDETTPVPPELQKLATRPAAVDRSAALIERLRRATPEQLGEMMAISPALADLNAERYRRWRPRFTARDSKPAALLFDGDVYGGLDAPHLSGDDLVWAQRHLAILSGLHGLLRPLDRIRPYRLEMGTRLGPGRGDDLYGFWGREIADRLDRMVATHAVPVLVNLASVEYFKAAGRPRAPVIDCVFEEGQAGRYRIVSFHAKRARGLMARHAVVNRIASPDGLKGFDAEGYRYEAAASKPGKFVFRRAPPGVAGGT